MVSSLLTVMTWNIWFDKTNRCQRTEILLNEIKTYDPDIIALQEVVEESMQIILAKMRPTYYIIGKIAPEIGYDTLILSKFPPIQWNRYNLPNSKMGRNLLLTTLQTPTRQITVGTFHLESVFYRRKNTAEELKKSQLKYICAISPINSILLGDTNLVQDEGPHPLPSPESPDSPNNPPIIDIYYMSLTQPQHLQSNDESISLDSEDLGASATYCGQTNKHVKDKSLQSRLDRIYVKIKRNSLKVHFYGLTGKITQPSDHYGVFSQIEF
jgi:endonuclease/exonuclease/phosphatase family metal-dependent hydrolase